MELARSSPELFRSEPRQKHQETVGQRFLRKGLVMGLQAPADRIVDDRVE